MSSTSLKAWIAKQSPEAWKARRRAYNQRYYQKMKQERPEEYFERFYSNKAKDLKGVKP